MKIFRRKAGHTLFRTQKEWRNFGTAEGRTIWQETKTMQNKLSTTCNKNKQENAKIMLNYTPKDEENLEDLWRDYYKRSKQVY